MKKNRFIFNCILSSLLSAFSISLMLFAKVPLSVGYIHFGDFVIFVSSCLLPRPYSLLCAAVSGSVADIINGYPLYVLPTVLIKCTQTLLFSDKTVRMYCKRNVCASVFALFFSAVMYFFTDLFVLAYAEKNENLAFLKLVFSKVIVLPALSSLPLNVLQGVISIILFIICCRSLDKFNIKGKMKRGNL